MPILIPPPEPLSEDAARFLVIGRCVDRIRQFAAERYGADQHQIAVGMVAALVAAVPPRPGARLTTGGATAPHRLAARTRGAAR